MSDEASTSTKLRRGQSCVVCQHRKVRCDRKKPCSNCVKSGIECRMAPVQAPRRQKRKFNENELVRRLRTYESLLEQHNIATSHDIGETDDDDDDLLEARSFQTSRPEAGVALMSSAINTLSGRKHEQLKIGSEEHRNGVILIQGDCDSAQTEQDQSALYSTFDSTSMLRQSKHFHFSAVGPPSRESLSERHPSPIQILQLWQRYVDNVEPLLKVIHVPSLQKQIIDAGADIARVEKSLEALMFSIYLIAVTSLSEEETRSMLGVPRSDLLRQYNGATQQALVNAAYMSSGEIVTLQAHFIYLLCIGEYTDPKSHSCLVGVAVRVAQRLSLHRSGAQYDMSPFEDERRRRLWWNLIALDKRIGGLAGTTVTAFSSMQSGLQRPLNANDSDLHIDAKYLPQPSEKPTEMVFALARFELVTAETPNAVRPLPTKERNARSHGASKSPTVLAHFTGYQDYVEDVFLKNCDSSIPLHLFTQMMTRQNLCKLHLLSNINRVTTRPTSIPAEDRAWLLTEAIQMIEYDNVVQSSSQCRGFLWFSRLYSPFPAYMFLAHELRDTSNLQLCERAWSAISTNHKYRGMMRALQPPIHRGMAKLFLEAWDAWVASQDELGRPVRTVEFILQLRRLSSLQSGQDAERPQDHSQPLMGRPKDTDMPDWNHSGLLPPSIPVGDLGDGVDWALLFPQQFMPEFDVADGFVV